MPIFDNWKPIERKSFIRKKSKKLNKGAVTMSCPHLVYCISTPNGKFKYYGTTYNLKKRMYKHKYRFNKEPFYPIYRTLKQHVEKFEDCKIEVIKEFKDWPSATLFEQKMIEKDGNLNAVSAPVNSLVFYE